MDIKSTANTQFKRKSLHTESVNLQSLYIVAYRDAATGQATQAIAHGPDLEGAPRQG